MWKRVENAFWWLVYGVVALGSAYLALTGLVDLIKWIIRER